MTKADSSTESPGPQILLTRVRIRNFRSLRAVTVSLSDKTLLIGENNAGKTSFARAVYAAIGSGQRLIEPSDVFLKPSESQPPKSRAITIDIQIEPAKDGKAVAQFDPKSPWIARFGNGISISARDTERAILRTEYRWNHESGEYVYSRCFLKDWPNDEADDSIRDAVSGERVGKRQIGALEASYLDADRDIADEIRARGSNWRRLVADLGLSDKSAGNIQESLRKINETLTLESDVLNHLETHLNRLFETISSSSHFVEIAPVQIQLGDIVRSIDALISTHGGASFPLSTQGMGTRSLAALLTFQALLEWTSKRPGGTTLHPLLIIEEPEAHLQPQAQRSLASQLLKQTGQVVITTHSPYICSQADVGAFRVFCRFDGETQVREFVDFSLLSADEQRAIRRQVLNTRGDVLFSRCIVLFEGETEEQAIPAMIENELGAHPGQLGLTFVGTGGADNIPAFVRLASTFGIPWRVLMDGESEVCARVNSGLAKLGEPPIGGNPRIITAPDGSDFEAMCATHYPTDFLCDLITRRRAVSPNHEVAVRSEWTTKCGDPKLVAEELRADKTAYGALLALLAIESQPPKEVVKLIRGIREDLGLAEAAQ